MTSLMQGFAKARQVRIKEKLQAVEALNIWRKQRSLEFQQEVIATHALLAAETKQRLASEQVRLSSAHFDQMQRLQEVSTRAAAVQLELQQNEANRLIEAHASAVQRLKEVQARVLATRADLEKFRADRLTQAQADQQQRLQEFQALQAQSKEFLANVKSDRLTMAAKLKQELADYVTYIHLTVWGMDFSNVLAESRNEAPAISESVAAPTAISIEQFIETYIATLEGSLSLTQVVNDRDTVKDLLTTGAATLKVDPSEILNTLIKMVDLDN